MKRVVTHTVPRAYLTVEPFRASKVEQRPLLAQVERVVCCLTLVKMEDRDILQEAVPLQRSVSLARQKMFDKLCTKQTAPHLACAGCTFTHYTKIWVESRSRLHRCLNRLSCLQRAFCNRFVDVLQHCHPTTRVDTPT
jgi:hypothetical protein